MKNRIKEIRSGLGLSQRDLGRLLNRKQSDISKLETGEKLLTADVMHDVAQALEVYPTELIDDPAWRISPEGVSDQLMQVIVEAVAAAAQEDKKVTPAIMGRVILSLYKKRLHRKLPTHKQLAADIELLIEHERNRGA